MSEADTAPPCPKGKIDFTADHLIETANRQGGRVAQHLQCNTLQREEARFMKTMGMDVSSESFTAAVFDGSRVVASKSFSLRPG